MAPQTHYPLIGIDWHRNETAREWPGRNWEDAAAQLAKHYGFVEVLSNATGQKRGGNGSGMYNRKPLYKAPAAPTQLLNGSGRDLPAAPTLTDLLNPRSTLPGLSLMKAPSLIKMLRAQGIIFELKYVNSKRILLVDKQITCSVTNKQFGEVKDRVRERRNEFIEALEAEADESQAPPQSIAPSEPPDPLKGKKLHQIILSMLPQMPTPFNVDDLADRLRVAGYTELSQERARLFSGIHTAKLNGHVTSTARAKYEVTEACRHRRHPPEQPKEEVDTAPQSELPIEPAPDIQDTPMSMEAYQPPRNVIEVPAPEEPMAAPETVADSPTEPRMPLPNPDSPLLGMVLDLASQAAASDDDNASLAQKLTAAGQQFETTMLQAVDTLSATIKAVADQLNHKAAARKALLQSLTGQS